MAIVLANWTVQPQAGKACAGCGNKHRFYVVAPAPPLARGKYDYTCPSNLRHFRFDAEPGGEEPTTVAGWVMASPVT